MNRIKINSTKHATILCIFLSLATYLIQEKVDGPINARSVYIYLNVMKLKHSEFSHSMVSTNRSYYHITGYQVQNRIIFPLFLKGADLIVTSILGQGEGYEKMSMRAKDLRMKFLRAFYSMIYLFSIFAMYLLVFIFLKKYINNDESIVYTGLLFFICSVLIFIAPPKMHKVEDQLQVILFIAVLIYIIENRYISD